MMPRVVVTGGSVGGLTAALVLRDAGCDVTVFERSSAALQARGAGIATLEATLRYLTERGGRQVADVCSSTNWIRFLRADGSVRHEQRHRYLFSSWNTIYRSLLGLFDPDRYLLGREVTGFSQAADSVRVTLDGGQEAKADMLVCADGVSSPARARLLPEVRPSYAGYVAWRGTLPEQALTAATRERFGDAITYQVLKDSHILVYPIPGPGGLGGDQGFVPPEGSRDGALTPGERLVNFVWYVNVAEGEALDELMTGRDGIRRAVSLPPGVARDEAVTVMRRAASRGLAPPIAEVVTGVAEPFVQVVYDIAVPRMAFGRVCLIGDAAFAVRPHAAAGTAKAAADGWALAAALTAAGGDVPAALARWERGQLALGQTLLARCRDIGDSSQVHGTFRPGDQRLIFGLYEPGH
jgi:2,6-dihydroxypyridine 3-monooxygenase